MMGIPSVWLMKNAGEHVAQAAIRYMSENRRAAIFCGSGNNGGDGIAAGVYLIRRGFDVRVILVGEQEKMTPDTKDMELRLMEVGGRLEQFSPADSIEYAELSDCAVIIDCIFGLGLSRPLTGNARLAVELINSSAVPVVAADIPSGVEADTGRIMGVGVKCTETVTFSMAKPGHFAQPGCTLCGELSIVDIGIPKQLIQSISSSCHALTPEDVRLPKRPRISHKGDYGRLLIIGGSIGYTGAVSLASHAAVRSGAGLVSILVPQSIYNITAVKNDEAMPYPLPDCDGLISGGSADIIARRLKHSTACVIGPGLGRSPELSKLVPRLVSESELPMVIDADGLYALSQNMQALKDSKAHIVLTPHEGEFARLGGILTENRIQDARDFSKEYGCVLVLKGHRTVCAFPDGSVYIVGAGNPGMAKGGSGDVLSGIIGAFIAQLPLKQAVTTAAFIHSHTGDLCARYYGEYSMTPSDIIRTLPETIMSITV